MTDLKTITHLDIDSRMQTKHKDIMEELAQKRPFVCLILQSDGSYRYYPWGLRADQCVFALEQAKHNIFMEPYIESEDFS